MMRALLVTGTLLLAMAAPAQATLLVRSDGGGLLVQDKNGLSDQVFIGKPDSSSEFEVNNQNSLDLFKFDRQVGCRETEFGFRVICVRDRLW